ncbi:uncharacterized protein [Primulina eburnea]|uniref:uncharacterized protein n=1 Tax=Primulina eburnea TaxID=1245227 RepID=UPI003C6BEDAD
MVMDTIKSMLAIPVVQGFEVYLGLPVFSARKKVTIPVCGGKSGKEDAGMEWRVDFRYWSFDSKGRYSVKEGYKAEIALYDSPSHSSTLPLKDRWKFLWALSLPPKVRIFLWRALNDIIPTSVNLSAHHVPTSGVFPLCNYGLDTTSHALFACPIFKPCWKYSGYWLFLKGVRFLDVFDIFIGMKENLGKLEFEFFAMRTYAIWSERLKIVHKQKSTIKLLNVDWSEVLLHEFQSGQSSHLKITCPPTASPFTLLLDSPPFNQLCLDVDAAYKETSNQFAIGRVVRDNEGRMVLAFGMTIFKPQSVALAELGAIAAGIRVVQEHNILINHINSDSFLTVQEIMCPEEDLSYVGSCVEDIRQLLEQNGI